MDLKNYEEIFDKEYKKHEIASLDVFNSIDTFNSYNSSNLTYSLKRNHFYYSKNVLSPLNSNEKCKWRTEENNYKMLYLSYKTLNNRFEIPPNESFIEITPDEAYYIDISINLTEDLTVTPLIIHYVDGRKTKLTNIVHKNQLLKFEGNENKCRLTFKIKGSGDFTIEHIKLLKLRQGVSLS